MKQASLNFLVASFFLITLLSVATATAQNTLFGSGALASRSAGNLNDGAFGFKLAAAFKG